MFPFLILIPTMAIVGDVTDTSWMHSSLTSGLEYNVHTCWSPGKIYLQFIYPDKLREEIAWVVAEPSGFP